MKSKRPLLFEDCYLLFPKDDEIVTQVDKVKVRKIFEGHVQFDAGEVRMLKDFDEYLKQKRFPFRLSDAQKLRMLYATKFKFDKCHTALVAYVSWQENSLPPRANKESLEFLENGSIYTHGRDNRFRPIIIVDAAKLTTNTAIEVTLNAMTIFLEYILQNYMLPGQIENWVVIMDLGGLGITSLPRQQLQRVMEYLQNNYRSRMHRCYVVNCPSSITLSWSMIKGFMEEITVRKISFEKSSVPTGLFTHCHPSQIEQRYNGNSPTLKAYWPPKEVSREYFLEDEDKFSILVNRAQYQEMHRNGKLANNKVCLGLIGEESMWKAEIGGKVDEVLLIDQIIFAHRQEYQVREKDEFAVPFELITISAPKCLVVKVGKSIQP